ncbi:MAG: hypothetical protein KGL39_03680 [Patescibacteria group bacterium]|nr:hypothetical protein [Patescibacteria group bacterium]
MPNPIVSKLLLPAADTNGIAHSQTPGGAGNLTLNGDLVSGGVANLVVAQRVAIHSAADDTGITWTVTGTDRFGNAQTDSFAGVNNGYAYSALDFLTVTQIAISGAAAGAVTAGTNGKGSTQWFAPTQLITPFNASAAVVVSGTVNYTVEYTYDDPNRLIAPNSISPPTVWAISALSSKSANTDAAVTAPIAAIRCTVNSVTSPGYVVFYFYQSGWKQG